MIRFRFFLPLLALFAVACESTPEGEDGKVEGAQITIPPDDLEPAVQFVSRTKRILWAEFIRVEMSAQLYESQIGLSRDLEHIERTNSTLEDGTVVVVLKRRQSDQKENFDPDRLPRLYFGTGLEARAGEELRIYIRRRVDKDRPIFLKITGVSRGSNATLWVGGREEKKKPRVTIESSMLWSETFERYKHKSAIY
ncbi:MAG: hypothetical protein AAGD14_08160 [Planctomycetota bacterium]